MKLSVLGLSSVYALLLLLVQVPISTNQVINPLILKTLLVGLGVGGPALLGLLALTGVGLGAAGSALGGTALGLVLALKKKFEEEEEDMYPLPPTYWHNGYSSPYGRRRRDVHKDLFDEAKFDEIKKIDPQKCTEKLVCALSSKMHLSKNRLPFDEMAIVSMIRYKPQTQKESEAHTLLEEAFRNGFQYNCTEIYPSCQHSADFMMNFIRFFIKSIQNENPSKILGLFKR